MRILYRFQRQCFNSKLVRLKVKHACPLQRLHHCFNSKLVRLKGTLACPPVLTVRGFNSKLVRLKVENSHDVNSEHLSFNSKLVRLKVSRNRVSVSRTSSTFQFQTGSIKSYATMRLVYPTLASFNSKLVRLKGFSPTSTFPNNVSIPNWFD